MKIKENKTASFIIVAVVYALATVLGIWLYNLLPFAFWLNLLLADIAATVFTFIFSLIFQNASVYDPYWSVQPIVILVAYAISDGLNVATALLLIAVCVWGLRLTANWAYTFGNLTHQDWRYTMLSQTTGKLYPIVNFVGIHLVPTLVVYGCVLPAVFAFKEMPAWNAGSIVFFILSLAAVCLQGTADIQMHRYRKNRTSPFIRVGVWKHARHPNYLAEISMWWTIGLAVLCVMPDKWYLLAGALANTLLFLCVSIPLAEGRQSKKEGYAEYKAQTRALLPIPKKSK